MHRSKACYRRSKSWFNKYHSILLLTLLVLLFHWRPDAMVASFVTDSISSRERYSKQFKRRSPFTPRFAVVQPKISITFRANKLQMAMLPMIATGSKWFVPLSAMLHVLLGSTGTPIVARAISVWYSKIDKPAWTPPNRIFAPVWTLLYSLMGVSCARMLRHTTTSSPFPWIWAAHMALNLSWAPVFFGYQCLRTGLYINGALLLSLCGVILPGYWRIDRFTAYLLFPYTLWLLYATTLNWAIARRNPGPYNNARFYAQLDQLQQKAKRYADSF